MQSLSPCLSLSLSVPLSLYFSALFFPSVHLYFPNVWSSFISSNIWPTPALRNGQVGGLTSPCSTFAETVLGVHPCGWVPRWWSLLLVPRPGSLPSHLQVSRCYFTYTFPSKTYERTPIHAYTPSHTRTHTQVTCTCISIQSHVIIATEHNIV